MNSIISKPPRCSRNVANVSGAVLTNNGQIKLDLNKDFLTAEHLINIAVSQAFTGVPTSSDVRRFFSKIELVTDQGTIFSCDFHQFYDGMRFTEQASFPAIVLAAASTAYFSIAMHHANHESITDLLTSLRTADFSTISIILTVSADAANGFIGGTVPLAASYQVSVDSIELPGLVGVAPYGQARHNLKQMKEVSSASVAVTNEEVVLKTGGRTRFILLHSYNTTGAIPLLANGIIDKVNLAFGGVTYLKNKDFRSIQQENIAKRNFNQAGVAVIDLGKNPKGWLPMENINEVKLEYSTLGTKPAGWKVTVAQDWTDGLAALKAV